MKKRKFGSISGMNDYQIFAICVTVLIMETRSVISRFRVRVLSRQLPKNLGCGFEQFRWVHQGRMWFGFWGTMKTGGKISQHNGEGKQVKSDSGATTKNGESNG